MNNATREAWIEKDDSLRLFWIGSTPTKHTVPKTWCNSLKSPLYESNKGKMGNQ